MKTLALLLSLVCLTGCKKVEKDREPSRERYGGRLSPRLVRVTNAPDLCVVVYTQADHSTAPVAMVTAPCPPAEAQ